MKIEVDENAAKELKELSMYLKKKGITATDSEIIMAAIMLAKRLGADKWTFVCYFKQERK